MDGWLNIVKPPGMSSHDVVNWARKQTGKKRIGHTGTLDPAAAGVLTLAVGKAARLIEYIPGLKTYRAEIILGIETDTEDKAGKLIASGKADDITPLMLEQALTLFRGQILQVPPVFSAVKRKGTPSYVNARKGKDITLEPRLINISRLELCSFMHKGDLAFANVDIDCSAGSYIRALARDIGQALGCGGCLGFLLRLRAGPFYLGDTFSLEEIENSLENSLLPLDFPLINLPEIDLTADAKNRFINGQIVPGTGKKEISAGSIAKVYQGADFLGVGVVEYHHNTLFVKPRKVIAN